MTPLSGGFPTVISVVGLCSAYINLSEIASWYTPGLVETTLLVSFIGCCLCRLSSCLTSF